jgi:LysM repeat protein
MSTRVLQLLLAISLGVAAPGAGVAEAQVQTNVHTVEQGETVQAIAAAYGLESVSVMAANALPNPDALQVGQSLVIPPVDGILHTVTSGETLLDIANRYQVNAADLVAANALESSDDLAVGEVLMVPGVKIAEQAVQAAASQAEATVPVQDRAPAQSYVVQEGDTLRTIAEALNLDILSLVAENALENPDLIRPGSVLHVAHPTELVVQAGDTVGDIAWRYSVDANTLLRVNGLEDADRIVTGMTLVVPLGVPAAVSAPPAQAVVSQPAPVSTPKSTAARATPVPRAAAAAAAEPAPAPPAATARSAGMTAMVTGYALGAGAVSTHTASGTVAHWGTVAADTQLSPFGTRVRIEGLGDNVFTVEDTGSAVRGNVFDVWFPDAASARRLGATRRAVTILAPGEP